MRKRALCVFGLLGLRGLPMLVFGCERELDGQRGAGFMLTLGAKQIGGGSNREARIEVLVVPGTLELIPAVEGPLRDVTFVSLAPRLCTCTL